MLRWRLVSTKTLELFELCLFNTPLFPPLIPDSQSFSTSPFEGLTRRLWLALEHSVCIPCIHA
jgi:hypothetical protein